MKKPDKFETIKQPPNSKICGAAVCAMALSKTLDEVLIEVDWRKLTYISGIAEYLAKYGITIGLWIENHNPEDIGKTTLIVDPKDRPAILCVKSAVFEDGEHWVFWDGNIIRDPSIEQEKYEVLETHYLTYWEEPYNYKRLPEDWRYG